MKKMIAFILMTFVLLIALGTTAYADEVETTEEITTAEEETTIMEENPVEDETTINEEETTIVEEETTEKLDADALIEQLDNEKVNELIELIDKYANEIDAEETTFWGKVKVAVLENKSEIALAIIGIAFVVSAYVKKKVNKELADNVATMNNNAVEVANNSQQAIAEDKEALTQLLGKLTTISDSDDLLQAMVNEATAKLNEKEDKNKNTLNAVVESNQALAKQIEALLVLSNISDDKKEAIRNYMSDSNAKIEALKQKAEE